MSQATIASEVAVSESAKADPSVRSALRTLDFELGGIAALKQEMSGALGERFAGAVELLQSLSGRAIVSGMGKSGHIGQKIAATLSSVGTPAFFVHPGEASHGDLGMITPEDAVIALSWSGETAELANLLTYARRFAVPIIAITSRANSSLAKAAHHALVLPQATEACPHGLAPTTSSLMQLAIGDALAIALLEGKGFTAHDFKVFHPGGQLGAKLKHVGDFMHTGERLPLADADTPMSEALVLMTEKSFGCLGVVDGSGKLIGILTDGDLRRNMGDGLLAAKVREVMTRAPKTIGPDALASAALNILNTAKITALFVVEEDRPVGIVHIHDLLRLGVA
ncbi:MAG: SIS domain-containing protein, partial [Dichotomicrobium sp.]